MAGAALPKRRQPALDRPLGIALFGDGSKVCRNLRREGSLGG